MFRNTNTAFTLSLILHLGLFLAISALLPQSIGENRIFQVYLATTPPPSTGNTPSSGDAPSTETETKPESLPLSAGGQTQASASSASAIMADEPDTDMNRANHPALPAVQPEPQPVTKPVFLPASHAKMIKSRVADTLRGAPKKPTSQSIFTQAESAPHKGPTGVTEKRSDPAPKTKSEDSHPGPGTADQAFGKAYFAAILAKIEAAKRYPAVAMRRRMEGNVEVVFRLGRDGGLLAVDLANSSGYRHLDEAAITAVHRAAPFPPVPKSIKDIPKSLKITISFILTTTN